MSDKISTLKELLKNSENKFANRNAFYLKDKDSSIYGVTYGKFKKDVDALGTALLREVNGEKKNIAIFLRNCYEWCTAYMAITGGVGTVVPLDRYMPFEELYNIIDFAEIDVIVTDLAAADMLLKGKTDRKIKIICTEEGESTEYIDYGELLEKGSELVSAGEEEYLKKRTMPDDMAALLFTSGTTGMTKGVMLSNYNICSDLIGVCEYVTVKSDDVSLSVLPLHHAYESIAFLMIIFSGGAISFCDGIRRLKENFAEYRPTVFVTVPLMLEKLHERIVSKMENEGKRNKARLISKMSSVIPVDSRKKIFSEIHSFFGGRLRMIISGAAALQKETAKDFMSYGIPVIIGYGLTECSPIVICNNDTAPTVDTIGKPLPGVQVKIDSPDENGVGEICVKGSMVMKGYYKNKAQTDSVIIDGWFHTGDVGYRDKNGNYHISGRIKNVIVTKNGKNIYPEELEYYLDREAVIAECVVSHEGSDIITAEILPDTEEIRKKLKKNTLRDEEIHAAVKEVVRGVNRTLPSYKRIKKVVLRHEEFDKTSTHKIKRHN